MSEGRLTRFRGEVPYRDGRAPLPEGRVPHFLRDGCQFSESLAPLVLGTGTAFPRDGERPPFQGTGAHLPSDGYPLSEELEPPSEDGSRFSEGRVPI